MIGRPMNPIGQNATLEHERARLHTGGLERFTDVAGEHHGIHDSG